MKVRDMRFTKMHGLSNDYIYVNCFEETISDPAGVAVVVMVPEILRNVLGAGFVNWRYLLFGAALVIVAIYRPQGIWPSGIRARELTVEDIEEGEKKT